MLVAMLLQYTIATKQLPVIETYETSNYTESMVDCQQLGESEIAKILKQISDDSADRMVLGIKQICLEDSKVTDFWASGADVKPWRGK